MRIYELLDTYPPECRYGERGDGIPIQQKPLPLGAPSLQERAGVRLLGLLKHLCPEPVATEVAAHVDATTVEAQVVCAVTVQRVSI